MFDFFFSLVFWSFFSGISRKVEVLNDMAEKIVKIPKKGQLVVPSEIRKKEGLSSSDRFIILQYKKVWSFKK